MQKIQVRLLGREDPLEEGMSIHSSILAWRAPWTGYSLWSLKELDMIEQQTLLLFTLRWELDCSWT